MKEVKKVRKDDFKYEMQRHHGFFLGMNNT